MSEVLKNYQGERGVSLIELLIVIAVISIVGSLALMQRGSANEQFQRQNVARELKVAFERARFDSVKRRATDPVGGGPDLRANVILTPNSFTLRTYRDVGGTLTPEDQIYTFPTGITAEGYGFALGASRQVFFNQRGESRIASVDPHFMICNGTCPTAPGASDVSNTVLVTPTGTVNLLGGGMDIPDFDNPTVSTVSNTAGVRPDVVLPTPTP